MRVLTLALLWRSGAALPCLRGAPVHRGNFIKSFPRVRGGMHTVRWVGRDCDQPLAQMRLSEAQRGHTTSLRSHSFHVVGGFRLHTWDLLYLLCQRILLSLKR